MNERTRLLYELGAEYNILLKKYNNCLKQQEIDISTVNKLSKVFSNNEYTDQKKAELANKIIYGI